MIKDLLLYGAGGAGREMAYSLSLGDTWKVKGFIDDTKKPETIIDTLPIVGGIEWLKNYNGNVAICIVGNPQIKKKLINNIKALCHGITFPVVISPYSFVPQSVELEMGEGAIVAQIFNHLTPGMKVGKFVWINSYNTLGHNAIIGDYTTLYSNIMMGGESQIGEYCVVGTGTIIKPGVKIGNNVTIGAGTLVIKDIPDNVVIVGSPAKIIKQKEL
jgi:sugar O-acyltransferase (sialic acid O-acetyltransferase NeuD family)